MISDFNVTIILVGLFTLVVSLVLHELMHALVGHLLGDDTAKNQGRITLNPMAHVDPLTTIALPLLLLALNQPPIGAAKPVPFNPHNLRWGEYGMALVAVAGPLTNLALAFVGSLLFRFLAVNAFWAEAFAIFTTINVVFFIINMIPIPPLDGSRVLYVFAPDGMRNFMNTMERFGVFLVLSIFILGRDLVNPFLTWAIEIVLNILP